MKKFFGALIVMMLFVTLNAFSQTAKTAESLVGKWEMTILGTPNGDAKMVVAFKLVEGKLMGEITNPSEAGAPANPLTSVDVKEKGVEIGFSAQGYDLNVDLTASDADNLEGMLMNMFKVKVVRIKQ